MNPTKIASHLLIPTFSFKKINELSKNDEEKAKDILKKLGYV